MWYSAEWGGFRSALKNPSHSPQKQIHNEQLQNMETQRPWDVRHLTSTSRQDVNDYCNYLMAIGFGLDVLCWTRKSWWRFANGKDRGSFGAVVEGGLAGIKNRVDGYVGCGLLPGCQRMTSEIFKYAMQSWWSLFTGRGPHVCLFVCLVACLLACLLASLLVCLFVCSFVCLFVCLFGFLFVCSGAGDHVFS